MTSSTTLIDLPDELLVAIAVAGIASQDDPIFTSDEEDRPEVHFAILLTHVCSKLRAVILSTPLLWSSPRLRIGPKHHSVRQLDAFLTRSNPCGVNLSLDFRSALAGVPNGLISAACLSAMRHIARWECVEIKDEWGICMPVVAIAFSGAYAPELRSLKLSLTSFPWRLGVPFAPVLMGGGPKLRRLDIVDSPIPWASIAMFPQLRTLSIFYTYSGFEPDYYELRVVLQALPKLTSLTLRGFSGPMFNTNPRAPYQASKPLLTLPSLIFLDLSILLKDSATGLLSLLRVPRLHGLVLGHTTPADLALISAGAFPPLPMLTHLYVTHSICDSGSFGFIRTLPALRRLLCVGRTSELLATLGAPGCCPCPQLETVALSWVEDEALDAVLNARKEAGFPIQDVQKLARTKGGIGVGIKAWVAEMMNEMVEAGVEVAE